ncbi:MULTISPECIES: response regulator [unclassified Variovorax]|uniref:hybrid sensor histidine kinase/response regulator n=1 Tax=unclassified Variovorax TaxID=663243 RepID=UPI001BD6A1D8|nr:MULTISPECIES: response regulator [unclassified Variovorax]
MSEHTPEFRPIDRSLHELLIVDDDPASRYATARTLRNAGFRTREAASGVEGLRLADDGVSALVLDVHLPDIDGFELCRRLRSRPETNRLPVLHLTAAYVTDEDKVRGLDSGADAYLTRPVEPAVLVATVQALVRARVAEEAMRRSETKFRAIYSHTLTGIGLLDEEGRLLDANAALLTLLGRSADEVNGRALGEFVPPELASSVDEYMRGTSEMPQRREFPALRPDGSLVHLEWSVSPHIERKVNMAVAIDISERVMLEEQRRQLLDRERAARGEAEQISRMKDDLIAVLSHELRAPLNVIMGWAHLLQKRGASEEILRGLRAIESNGRIQAKLITDLLDMSRLNLGKLPLIFESVDPSEVVANVIEAMRPAIDESAHVLNLQLAPPYRPILADQARLQQILWNLISNAIKFSPRGGGITVGLTESEEGVTLYVSDEGQGIEARFLPMVFDRFAQGDASSNRQRGGLGLGLAIVKQLVEAHGGSVSVESAGPDQGTTFRVWLPVSATALVGVAGGEETSTDAQPAEMASLHGVNLLIVDDDTESNAMLEMILSDRGGQVATAHSCDAALELLETLKPDVLISDIGMPGKDGYTLIREIRKREQASGHHMQAIALTAFARDRDQHQALEAGFDAHCAKPLQPLKLLWQIQRVLGRLPQNTVPGAL